MGEQSNTSVGSHSPDAPGSLADLLGPSEPVPTLGEPTERHGLGRDSLLRLGLLGLLAVLFYWSDLKNWALLCLGDKNWTHGFLIPLFSLYLLISWRRELLRVPRRACWPALAVVLLAVLIRMAAIVVIKNNFLAQSSLVLMILGLTLLVAGPRVTWVALVPILYLVLAVPIPKNLYESIALQLQNLAALLSTTLLRAFGAHIDVNASNMDVTSVSGQVYNLQVAEACSGVRSLMAFVALGVAMAYLERRPLWQRITMILAGIPIAIFVNILRVAVTTVMFIVDKRELGEDFMHGFIGMLMLIPALLLLMGLGKLMDMVYEDEDEEDEPGEGEDRTTSEPTSLADMVSGGEGTR